MHISCLDIIERSRCLNWHRLMKDVRQLQMLWARFISKVGGTSNRPALQSAKRLLHRQALMRAERKHHYLGAREAESRDMAKLITHELSLVELGTLTDSARLDELRRSEISVVWAPIPEFDAYVLNIFAPTSYVFWNFFVYESLLTSERKFHSKFQSPFISAEVRADTHTKIARLARQSGHKKRSDFTHDMLGAWTRTPDFNPDSAPTIIRYLGFRHFSMLVPTVDRQPVQEHFEKQAYRWRESCLFPYPETDSIWHYGDLDQNSAHWSLLYRPITKTSAEEREWLYAEAGRYDSVDKLKVLAATLDRRFAISGMINLAGVPSRFLPYVNMQRYADVLRLRARLALMICPLRKIEQFPLQMEGAVGIFKYPDGVFDEMLQSFKERLKSHRDVFDFEFPSTRGF